MSIALRVFHGIEFLDKNIPGGWANRIDSKSLNIISDVFGILPQLYGNSTQGMEALGLSPSEARSYGFLPDYEVKDIEEECQELERVWIRAIDARKTPATSPR